MLSGCGGERATAPIFHKLLNSNVIFKNLVIDAFYSYQKSPEILINYC